MKAVRTFYNHNWLNIIQQANPLACLHSEEKRNRALITIGDKTFPGTVDQDIDALASNYPKGTQILVKKEYLSEGPFPTRPIKNTMVIAIYEVL